jgi:hypothetical protein
MGSGMEFGHTPALGAGLKGGTHDNTHLDVLFSKRGATRERWVRFAETGSAAEERRRAGYCTRATVIHYPLRETYFRLMPHSLILFSSVL